VTTRRRPSLRLRITVGALVVVVGLLCGAGAVVLGAVDAAMTDQIDTALRADADFTERMLTSGEGLPMGEGPTDLYVQFVDRAGTVVGAGTAAVGRPDLSGAGQADGTIMTTSDPALGELRVLVVAAPTNPDLRLVLARSAAGVADVHDRLVRLLAALVVVGSALAGALVWFVVGRALRPVEAMRATVDRIDDHDLRARVALPGTGDELDRLATTLNDLLARLDGAVARERQFVADASHDLRTPIAAVRATLETETADPALVVLTRADALGRLDQLQDLVDQLLALARADDPAPVPNDPVDLDELVLACARHLARTTGRRIDTSRVSGGQVAGRDTDLGRVVENLASNAARHATSTVSFAVHQFGDTVELLVDDDGPGIAAGDRARVFERFGTLDEARSPATSGPASTSSRPVPGDGSGSGLGLAIVEVIVRRAGGTVRIGDAPGGGARFEVRLPAYRPAPGPTEAIFRRPPAPPREAWST